MTVPGSDPAGRWVVLAAVLAGTGIGTLNSSVANVAVLDVLDEFDAILAVTTRLVSSSRHAVPLPTPRPGELL